MVISSKDRVIAALNHKYTDRIPITFDAELEVYESLQKYLKVQTKEQLFDQLNVDTWMILPKNFITRKNNRVKR